MQATVFTIINDHAKGFHDAKKLALQLYEGYGFRKTEPVNSRVPLPKYLRAAFGDDDAFQALWNHEYTGSKLKGLADYAATGPQLAQLYARINATQLKTPALKAAYLQALDALERGAGQTVLSTTLRTAFHERNRYFANRIAQTELHRAYTDQKAAEIMADDGFDFVQIRLSGTHPKTDICDLHAKVDKYGLGPGVYPKAHAPKPPFHPFCRCLTAPRAWVDGVARARPHAEREYLNSLSVDNARQVMGGAERLQAMRKGARLDDVLNAGKAPMYYLKRLGEFGEAVKPVMIDNMTKSAYEIAKDGGKHGGMLKNYREKPTSMIERSIRSMKKQIDLHESWIKNPYLKLKPNEDQRRVSALVNKKWPEDIQRIKEEADVLSGLLQERKQ